jgi:hypothetical protein
MPETNQPELAGARFGSAGDTMARRRPGWYD